MAVREVFSHLALGYHRTRWQDPRIQRSDLALETENHITTFISTIMRSAVPRLYGACAPVLLRSLVTSLEGLRLDRSTARYIYKAKNGKLLVVLTPSQKAKLIFEQYIQTLFNKDLF